MARTPRLHRRVETDRRFWNAIAAELAQSLNPILPVGIRIECDGTNLSTVVEGDRIQSVNLDLLEGSDPEGSTELMVSGIQDVVIRHIGIGWPSSSDDNRKTSDPIPVPHAEIKSDMLKVWFGDYSEPVLQLFAMKLGPSESSE